MTAALPPESVPDAGAFLARLTRMDSAALVRLRPYRPGMLALWARLPFEVLVTRLVRSGFAEDATVAAAELLAALEGGQAALPPRRDIQWRSPLPPAGAGTVDDVPTGDLRRIAQAAAATLRAATGRGVGERRLRDELLDHVALVVTSGDRRADVPVRLVQGVVRMGFLDRDDAVAVRIRAGAGWIGAEATYGSAWLRSGAALRLTPDARD